MKELLLNITTVGSIFGVSIIFIMLLKVLFFEKPPMVCSVCGEKISSGSNYHCAGGRDKKITCFPCLKKRVDERPPVVPSEPLVDFANETRRIFDDEGDEDI